MKNKNLIAIIVSILLIVIIGIVIVYRANKKPPLPTDEQIVLLLDEAVKVTGMDLDLFEQNPKWNVDGKEITIKGKGYYYTDKEASEIPGKIISDLDIYFKKQKFEVVVNELSKRYKKGDIVCNVNRIPNPNQTVSLSISCGDINNKLLDISTGEGMSCKVDSDCLVRLDNCNCKTVCRSKDFDFYSECSKSCSIQETDFEAGICKCTDGTCVGERQKASEGDMPSITTGE